MIGMRMISAARGAVAIGGLVALSGCAQRNNVFVEDGPSAEMVWDSHTASDARARFQPAPVKQREWPEHRVYAADGAVTHDPLWFENPFVEAGTGRVDDDPHGHTAGGRNKYRLSGRDVYAALAGLPWFVVDTAFAPVSMAIDPLWQLQESDGIAERRHFLGFKYDAKESSDAARAAGHNDFGPRVQSDAPGSTPGDPHAQYRGATGAPTTVSGAAAGSRPAPASSGPMLPMTPVRR
ncbi:MAG: hypothetical protein SF069_15090 [Phycisphaerae bacterium]|nr:hypothetical protein [Phycisphaerae bacterium]